MATVEVKDAAVTLGNNICRVARSRVLEFIAKLQDACEQTGNARIPITEETTDQIVKEFACFYFAFACLSADVGFPIEVRDSMVEALVSFLSTHLSDPVDHVAVNDILQLISTRKTEYCTLKGFSTSNAGPDLPAVVSACAKHVVDILTNGDSRHPFYKGIAIATIRYLGYSLEDVKIVETLEPLQHTVVEEQILNQVKVMQRRGCGIVMLALVVIVVSVTMCI